uniref:NAC domain-containing protein n=2 Tax=Setaria italica TaxID=4555 RepID=K4AKM0_SETIT
MVMISPVNDLAASHPLAANAAAAARASQPPVSNPESLFDDLGGMAAYAAAAGATVWSSQYPPYAPTATTSGGFNSSPSPSPMLSRSMTGTFFPPPAMVEPPYYWHPQTQPGFPPRFAPVPLPFAQGVMPPPVPVPVQITRAEPSYYHPQIQGSVASGSAAEAVAIVHAVPDTQKAQEATAPAHRRRGRPRKTDTAAVAAAKPVIKKPKRATVRSSRAAAPQPTGSSVAGSATMAGQVQIHQQQDQAASSAVEFQVQHPDQAASVIAVATSNQQTAPCTTNPMALLCDQEQWQLQPSCSNILSAGDQAAAAGPYADTSVAGVRFQPTDEELIFYLRLKHAGHKMPVDFFKDFDVYHEHPETSRAACGVVNGCWYAFSPRNRKYKNGGRPARSVFDASGVQVGYWKSNTKLAPVLAGGKADGALVGEVTSLTFHLGQQPKGTQTPWKMKEYAIPQNQHAPDGSAMRLNDWVVCKLFYKERVIKNAAAEEDQLSEAGENDVWAEGDEGTWRVPVVQTLGNSEQDLCVDYQIETNADDYLPWI